MAMCRVWYCEHRYHFPLHSKPLISCIMFTDHGSWQPYASVFSDVLEDAYQKKQTKLDLRNMPLAMPYKINLKKMEQIRVETNRKRKIQRTTRTNPVQYLTDSSAPGTAGTAASVFGAPSMSGISGQVFGALSSIGGAVSSAFGSSKPPVSHTMPPNPSGNPNGMPPHFSKSMKAGSMGSGSSTGKYIILLS